MKFFFVLCLLLAIISCGPADPSAGAAPALAAVASPSAPVASAVEETFTAYDDPWMRAEWDRLVACTAAPGDWPAYPTVTVASDFTCSGEPGTLCRYDGMLDLNYEVITLRASHEHDHALFDALGLHLIYLSVLDVDMSCARGEGD